MEKLLLHKKSHVIDYCPCCAGSNIVSSPAILMPFLSHRIYGWSPVAIDDSWGLKTIKSGHAYSICNSLFCLSCYFLFLDIRFTDNELALLYEDYRGDSYNSLREKYEPGYFLRNEILNTGIDYIDKVESFLEPFLSFPISILDWGGDTGCNTPFKNRSYCLDIYDISNKDVVTGARKVVRGEVASQSYDLVVCSNVLEHVPYPYDLLCDIKKALRRDSILYVEVPYEELMREDIIEPHCKKKHWHEHINFFSPKSLHALLANAGFEVISSNVLYASAGGKSSHFLQFACKINVD